MNQVLDDINFDNYVVIGVSAGPDSMCLLDLLEKKTSKIIVCHINHNIRKQSIIEENYLKEYCQKHNLIFETMTIKEYKENNFENEARKIRYNFYEEILKKYHSNQLFLAHHGDDLIETVLMKIERGSNIEGYAGIKRISKLPNYTIIRPLLPYTKEDIKNYNKSHNITYYIDSSNTNIDYTRNWYRHKVLPILKERKKDIHLSFLKYSGTLQEYNEYIDRTIQEKIPNIYQNNTINIDVLNREDPFIQKNILYYIMNNLYNNKSNIITSKHINNILSLVNNNKPNIKINLPQNKILIKEYNKLYIKDNNSNNNNYKLELKNNIKINNITFVLKEKEENDGNNICRLNSKDINFPLYFRNRKDGDYIILKNSNVKKKIKENAYIDSVKITRGLPDTLKIEVKERTAKLMLLYGNAYVYINNQGYILEISDEKAKLPVLKGYKTDEKDIVVGQRLCNEDLEMLSTVLKIMEVAQSEEIFDKITGIDIRNKSDYEIEMENEQKTAHLGDCSMLEERILWVKTILNETKDLQGEIFVNMNLNSDRPFFRERV